jgi:predicted DsbA family dithiol-disulfide isomerase
MAVYRLRKIWPEYADRVRIAWQALSLELHNREATPKNIVEAEIPLMAWQEPDLPIGPWKAADWQYPATILPAFEALRCAELQSDSLAWEFSWMLRKAFFADSRCISMRHVLLELSHECGLDVERFSRDWDSGAQRPLVIAESQRGWEQVKVPGSPTFVLPSGRRIHNPGALRVSWGPNAELQKIEPPEQPWLEAFDQFLVEAATHA